MKEEWCRRPMTCALYSAYVKSTLNINCGGIANVWVYFLASCQLVRFNVGRDNASLLIRCVQHGMFAQLTMCSHLLPVLPSTDTYWSHMCDVFVWNMLFSTSLLSNPYYYLRYIFFFCSNISHLFFLLNSTIFFRLVSVCLSFVIDQVRIWRAF